MAEKKKRRPRHLSTPAAEKFTGKSHFGNILKAGKALDAAAIAAKKKKQRK